MAKNSTLYSNVPFNSGFEKNITEKELLDNQVGPDDTIIANLIAFSKALKVEKSSQTGLIEMILN